MASTQRKEELSALNVLFCLLVVFIHVASHPVSVLDRMSWSYALILMAQRLAFVSVPGFFLLSGVKLTLPREKQQSLSSYYRGRAEHLLCPYVITSLIYYLVFVYWLKWFPFSLKDFGLYLVRGGLSAQFYFLIALVQFILLTPLFRWLARRWSPMLLIPFSVGIMWLSSMYFNGVLQVFLPGVTFQYSDRIFTSYLAYYMAGCCIGEYYPQFKEFVGKNRGLIWALAVFFALSDAGLSVLTFSGRRYIPYLEHIHTMYIFGAILALFDLALRLPSPLPSFVRSLDRISFDIYLWHCLVITLFNQYAPRLGLSRVSAQFIARFFVTYCVTIGGCLLWRKLVRGTRIKK